MAIAGQGRTGHLAGSRAVVLGNRIETFRSQRVSARSIPLWPCAVGLFFVTTIDGNARRFDYLKETGYHHLS